MCLSFTAFSADLITISQVARKPDGKGKTYTRNLPTPSKRLEIVVTAERYKVRLHEFQLVKSNGVTISLGDLQSNKSEIEDWRGRYFLVPRENGLVVEADSFSGQFEQVRLQLESYGGNADVQIEVTSFGGEEPDYPPVDPEPDYPPVDPEPQDPPAPPAPDCNGALYQAQQNLFSCQQQSISKQTTLGQLTNQQQSLQFQLDQKYAPLRRCENNKAGLEAELNALIAENRTLVGQVNDQRKRFRKLRYLNKLKRASKNATFQCEVTTRHNNRVYGEGKTMARALARAFLACTKNGCGKKNYDNRFLERTKCYPVGGEAPEPEDDDSVKPGEKPGKGGKGGKKGGGKGKKN